MVKSGLKLTDEDKLLLLCARTHLDDDKELQKLIDNNINWDILLKKAAHHHLMPLLYWNLKNFREELPINFIDVLKEYFDYNARKNLLMWGELTSLLKFMKLSGITPLPYKGPILAIEVYNNIALREFGDLDIYISEKEVLKILQPLKSLGYLPKFEIEQSKIRKFMETQRDMQFFHEEKNILLEIHWSFKNLFFSLNQELWDEKSFIKININDVEILNPTHEDMLLILCLHNASHRWSRLSWLCDVVELIESKKVDWNFILRKTNDLCIKRILSINLYLAKDLLGLKIPAHVIRGLENEDHLKNVLNLIKISLFKQDKIQHSLRNELKMSFLIRENKIDGIKDVIKGLTTPTIYEWKSFPLPVYLWRIYHFYRPLNLIYRHDWK